MADDPTEDIIKREVAEAARIIREDASAAHNKALMERLDRVETKLGTMPEPTPPEGTPPAPPKKDEPTETPKRKGLWWGENNAD